MRAFWRAQVRDAVELLLPALAAVLPWPFCFRLFGRLARWDWLYRDATRRALAQAQQRGWLGPDEREWARCRRLVTLVDHADFFLARTRSDAWLRRYVQVQGHWPKGGQPGILLTFHWGAGMWGLRHARLHGMQAHALAASLDKAHFKGRPVLHAYARARTACASAELGYPTLDASASLRPAVKALAGHQQVLAVIDVPADAVSACQMVTVLGQPARVPRGLLRLAVDRRVPVTLYLTGIDFDTGQRTLFIQTIGVFEDVDDLAAQAFALLDNALRQSPPSWHFWSEANRFFVNQGGLD